MLKPVSEYSFGLIWDKEKDCLYNAMQYLAHTFPSGINLVEVGCREMKTGKALVEICQDLNVPCAYYGIDVHKDYPDLVKMYPNMTRIIGDANSPEILGQLPNKIHFVFIDSCHCYNCVTSQGKLFSKELVRDGIIAFHDYGSQYQGVGGADHSEDHTRDGSTHIGVMMAVNAMDFYHNGYEQFCRIEEGHGIISFIKE